MGWQPEIQKKGWFSRESSQAADCSPCFVNFYKQVKNSNDLLYQEITSWCLGTLGIFKVTRKDHTTVTKTKQSKQDISLNLSLKLCVMKLRLLLGIQVSSKLVFLVRCVVLLNRQFPTPTWLCLAE